MNELRGLWRGKRLDNGEWVEGYLSKGRNAKEKPAFLKYCIDREETGLMMSYIVDPSTLCECTGLIDKNGKLIFEGDIIRYKKHLFCIEWSADICSFTSRALDIANFMPCVNVGTIKICEVIGNIHDNPELLKG